MTLSLSVMLDKGGKMQIIVTDRDPKDFISIYANRQKIETLFGCLKTRGFRFEDTHITAPDRIDRLLVLLAIEFCWAYKVGEWKHQNVAPIKHKSHGRRAVSLFRYGLDFVRDTFSKLQREVASFSQGSILNISTIARDTMIQQKMAASYFDILELLLIGYRLPVFSKRAKRKTTAPLKFYFFDAGVYQTLRPKGYIDSKEEVGGAELETLFLEEFRAINDYLQLDYDLFYWRTQSGIKVDFIEYGEKGLHTFEVKHASQINKGACKGLVKFKEKYPEAQCTLLYLGNERLQFDDVDVLPFTQSLQELPARLTG